MRTRLSLACLVLFLAGCRGATGTVTVSTTPTATAGAAVAQPLGLPPTPTALAEGLVTRLATPDASPNCPEHYPWFFENPAQECAATLFQTWGVLEPFEHGLMVWFQGDGRTYVLLDDGSLFKPYQEVVDLVGLPLPAPDPGLAPPPGRFQPVLGFGKFWRGLVPGAEWVRDRLGWATAPEAGYPALWQCNTSSGDAARCYFTGPRDEIIVMTRGSVQYWNYRQTAVR